MEKNKCVSFFWETEKAMSGSYCSIWPQKMPIQRQSCLTAQIDLAGILRQRQIDLRGERSPHFTRACQCIAPCALLQKRQGDTVQCHRIYDLH